jgi:hemolysin D
VNTFDTAAFRICRQPSRPKCHDDNVLDETYLAEAIKIKQEWPSLGVWGRGSVRGDFEVELPESLIRKPKVRGVRQLPITAYSSSCSTRTPLPAERVQLIAGMAVTAELKVGQRSVISYFLYPLLRGLDESIRE